MSEIEEQPSTPQAFKVILVGEKQEQWYVESSIRYAFQEELDEGELEEVIVMEAPVHGRKSLMDAFAYALNSIFEHPFTYTYEGESEKIDGRVATRLLVSEFAHALNRRHILQNDQVDPMITHALEKLSSMR